MSEHSHIQWETPDGTHSVRWRSENGAAPPKRVMLADDRMTADAAYRLASEGTALLWQGDFHNARQLLQALARRIDRPAKKPRPPAATPIDAFNAHRQAQSQRARTLAMLLLPFNADYTMSLRRAPDVQQACNEAYGANTEPFVTSVIHKPI